MKKLLSLTVAILLGIGAIYANPVDVNSAKIVGQKFVQTKFEASRGANLELVYTFSIDREKIFYVFNVDDNGFVVVSADDMFRPIVGYGTGETFDTENPARMYYLNALAEGRTLDRNKVNDPKVAEEWESVRNYGRVLADDRGRIVDALIQTKWNQNPAPYNSECPADPHGPGGHVYVGCVATAMAQIMNYWKYPTQGQGSHSYYCPGYGTLSANFGATTYDWDNMLNNYNGSYTPEQGNAVAILGYHCGVAVDMQYDGVEGSGTSSAYVPQAVASFFRYTSAVNIQYKGNLDVWINTLKTALDKGWPMYYSGSAANANAGHAFVCDGYDVGDYFHFNWGWGGSGDNWFLVGDIEYNTGNATITNFVPADVYNNTAQAPTNLTVTKTSDVAQEATLTWVNPSKTLNNSNITTIDQIVIERDGIVIHTIDNAAPGANMTWVDSNVPCYSTFTYKLYAVIGGARGNNITASESFGPTCEWKIVATTTSMTGWKGGALVSYDGAGREIDRFTMTSNNPVTYNMNITLGNVKFAWLAGTDNVQLTIKIKDSTGAVVYQYEGTSNNIPAGYLYEGNNGCGNAAPTEVPGELFASTQGGNVVLTWTASAKTQYGYNIYRDGLLFELAHDTEFVDETAELGGHCYQVCYLTDGGESVLSNEACASAGEGCESGRNLWYYIQENGKPMITWEHPATGQPNGYFVYRKVNEDGAYEHVKTVSGSKNEYKETKTLEDGTWYYYRIVPYYKETECYSAPIKSMYNNEYFVKVLYSVDGVEENMAQNVSVYPNPAKDMLTVKAENLSSVVIYNSLGQRVFAQSFDGNEAKIDMNSFDAGIYMVRINADGNEVTRKISVIR